MRLVAVVGLLCASFLFGSDAISAQEWEIFEGHAVKMNGTGKGRLRFKHTDAQNTEEFIAICKSMCESGEADGKTVLVVDLWLTTPINRKSDQISACLKKKVRSPMQSR